MIKVAMDAAAENAYLSRMRAFAIIVLMTTGCQAAEKPGEPVPATAQPETVQPQPRKPDRNTGCREVVINGFKKTLCN